tara:strand:- start:18754 stop:18972 length:219 start_codon:yes stop_codon:yes gene_type:complete
MRKKKLSNIHLYAALYRCRVCERVWYVEEREITAFDVDYGCPFGCDDNGKRLGRVEQGELVRAKEEKDDGGR